MTDSIERLSLFYALFSSLVGEMGEVLRRAAFSSNIRDRLDFSCALCSKDAELLALSSHIPIHTGAVHLTLREVIKKIGVIDKDTSIVVNDPYAGGTHHPDITIIRPFYADNRILFYLITRAHHADVGGVFPGSMGILNDYRKEGLIIDPMPIEKRGVINRQIFDLFKNNSRLKERCAHDLMAQLSALWYGNQRLNELVERYGSSEIELAQTDILNYGEKIFIKFLDKYNGFTGKSSVKIHDDGFNNGPFFLKLFAKIESERLLLDFNGTSQQAEGPINTTPAVVHACIFFFLNSLGIMNFPPNGGVFRRIDIRIPYKTILNPEKPASICAGSVETSQRLIDLFMETFRGLSGVKIPAHSQGTMNNILIGNNSFSYYETIGGGAGADSIKDGASAVHTYMTNTLNTPCEIVEEIFPIRINRYKIIPCSGGDGEKRGGDGILREYEFLQDCNLTILSGMRSEGPFGAMGGCSGSCGRNILVKKDGKKIILPEKVSIKVKKGERFIIKTPGGGGYGKKRD